jgi:signal transduction histidine kinase
MDSLRFLFERNREIILFVYGLIFFLLGLMIALQSRRYSRLDLARSLKWLAAFGFAHGLHEWGDLFIPIQATYLSDRAVQFWMIIQLVLLSISFAFLIEFGVTLLRPLGRLRWLNGVSAVIWITWGVGIALLAWLSTMSPAEWRNNANALARYFIGFPAGLLAAYGLRQQAFHRIAPLNVPSIVKTLRVAGFVLILYAIFTGLIVPPVGFFPGNILNTVTFEQITGIPVVVIRSLLGLILTITIFRALEIFDVENARTIEYMEQQQILAAERERIGRELHDGAVQTVYTAGLLVESASKLVEPGSNIADRLDRAVVVLNDAIHDLRRNLGELRPNPTDESLICALEELANDPRFRSMVDISLQIELPESARLSPVKTDHVIAIVNEALSNVVRHARARQVLINAQMNNGRIKLTIQDDGVGISPDTERGYGLRNMRDRARILGGNLKFEPVDGEGTKIELDIPGTDEYER